MDIGRVIDPQTRYFVEFYSKKSLVSVVEVESPVNMGLILSKTPKGAYKFRVYTYIVMDVEVDGESYPFITQTAVNASVWHYVPHCRVATFEELTALGEILAAAKVMRGEKVILHTPEGLEVMLDRAVLLPRMIVTA